MPQGPGLLLAVDQGTTNTKGLLVDAAGAPLFQTSVPVMLLQPQSGFIEQDPSALWQSVEQVIDACARHAANLGAPVAGIALSNQRETALAWQPGPVPSPIGNAISWQCRRSAAVCDRLQPHHSFIRKRTGLPVDPLASAGKWTWMLENTPGLRAAAERGDVRFGNVDSWLLANLTAGTTHLTDHSNASRTGLFDLETLDWNDDLLALFQIPRRTLPALRPSASNFGRCTAIAGLEGIPIVAMIGDSHGALFGHGSYTPGAVKATYGTGSSLMMLTRALVPESSSLARTIAWSHADQVQFALEGNVAMTGSAVQWVGEFLGLPRPIEDTVTLAATVPDAAGVIFVPAMVGLGAPYWDSAARGTLTNLGRAHTAAHLARAALDAIAFQVADVFFAMRQTADTPIPALQVDGGATRNDTLMQFQADLLDCPVHRSSNELLSALGAAWLGGLTLGWWTLDDLARLPQITDRFVPHSLAAGLYAEWKLAVARTRLQTGIGLQTEDGAAA